MTKRPTPERIEEIKEMPLGHNGVVNELLAEIDALRTENQTLINKEVINVYNNPVHGEIFRQGITTAIKTIHEPEVKKLRERIAKLEEV